MLVLDMLFVVSAVLFDMLKARQLACVSKSGQKCPAALRSPHGERGLKFVAIGLFCHTDGGRSPHGERGLKSTVRGHGHGQVGVALLMESVD